MIPPSAISPKTASSTEVPEVSVILGTLNRRRLLKLAIQSIRESKENRKTEIIVIDGGSTDGTCDWLARQRDVLTILQPNYYIPGEAGARRRAYSWGRFMNTAFRMARGKWIVMISDDIILHNSAISLGIKALEDYPGDSIGGGAFYWRDFPREAEYHVKLLPGRNVLINHGIFLKSALEAVGYINEEEFEFYGADGDLCMRLNLLGRKTIALDHSFAEHLNHRVNFKRFLTEGGSRKRNNSDMVSFYKKYSGSENSVTRRAKAIDFGRGPWFRFWTAAPFACLEGQLRRLLKI
jgi:glycosyltransferase involved in cell wall biosynthesis